MKTGLGILLAAGCLLTNWAPGCTHSRLEISGVAMPSSIELKKLSRSEYRILGKVTGNACSTYVGLWPIPIFWVQSEDKSAALYQWNVSGAAREAAVYNAIASAPNADALVAPRFEEEVESAFVWRLRRCVTVTGKAVSIKTDVELASGTPSEGDPGTVPSPVDWAKEAPDPGAGMGRDKYAEHSGDESVPSAKPRAQSALRSRKEMRSCVSTHVSTQATLSFKCRLTIAPAGSVAQASILTAEVAGTALGKCLLDGAMKLEFPSAQETRIQDMEFDIR